MKSILKFIFGGNKNKSENYDSIIDRYKTANENLNKISKIFEDDAKKRAFENEKFNLDKKKSIRNLVFYHSLVMDNEKLYKQGTPMNITLANGLHCVAHHVFWDDMEQMLNDDKIIFDFYYKGGLLVVVEIDTSHEDIRAKILNDEDFSDKEIEIETYLKCMTSLVKKFELRWAKYKQEEKVAKQERKHQKKIRQERNVNRLEEFLNQ